MHSVIVIPTYNEKENISNLIPEILKQINTITTIPDMEVSILIVDDNSPDGTAKVVRNFMKMNRNIFLITGNKSGLGKAYIRGFAYAIDQLKADVVMEMDADFSHNPKDIRRLLKPIYENTADFVIGSRYIHGGSIPSNWGTLRKLNSAFGNKVARHIAGIKGIRDCTAGFRAIRVTVLQECQFQELNVEGYAFQINILHAALRISARITEVPVHFIDRTVGTSKIRFKDISEFIINALKLRFPGRYKYQTQVSA